MLTMKKINTRFSTISQSTKHILIDTISLKIKNFGTSVKFSNKKEKTLSFNCNNIKLLQKLLQKLKRIKLK